MLNFTRKLICAAAPTAILLSPALSFAQSTQEVADVTALLGFVRGTGVVLSIFVLIGASVVLRFVSSSAERLGARFAHRRLTVQKFESFARLFIYLSAATIALALSFDINQKTLGLIAAALALPLGFALKDLVASVIAGITIMFDRPFQVGDRVQYAGQYGDIITIGLRSVRMRTLDDNTVTIPNNKILTDVTSSGNYGELDMQVVMKFYIGSDQDLSVAERLIKESLLTSRYVYLEKPIVVLVEQTIVADLVVIELIGKAYVLDTKYEKAFKTDVSKRVLDAFRNYGVLMPAAFSRSNQKGDGLADAA